MIIEFQSKEFNTNQIISADGSLILAGLCFKGMGIKFNEKKESDMATTNKILEEALTLKPTEKAELIDRLLSSLDKPDAEIDELWAKEAENRIDAYERGEIKAIALEKVLERYK